MENKNTIIALILMLVVWVGFTTLYPSVPTPPQETTETASTATQENEPPRQAEVKPVETPADLAREQIPADTDTREIVVENEHFRAVLTNAGAALKSLQLKKYRVESKKDASLVALAGDGPGYATLLTNGQEGFYLPPDARFAITSHDTEIQVQPGESKSVSFVARLPGGIRAEKVYTFHGDSYQFDLELRLTNIGRETLSGRMALSLVEPWKDGREATNFEFLGPSTLAGEKVYREDVEDLAKQPRELSEKVAWTGFESRYFLSAAVPLQGSDAGVRVEKTPEAILNKLFSDPKNLAPGETVSFGYLLYYGPKDLDLLKEAGHELAEALDFGLFSPIALPLLYVLKFFYTFLGNYGLAIILLTVIIKLLFWPLTQKSYASMKNMQKLQPEMQKIREKHKSDRERLNREIMELYRKHRVNPLGGCLPMVVQIPVFFALYKVLMEAIELRHAPFFLWIMDLSAKDPYYITPLIMGATMFVQQKMTPSTMDPTQAKLFMLMPVIFTFMFLNFPSGLVIYWLVNNLLTIGQQWHINHKA